MDSHDVAEAAEEILGVLGGVTGLDWQRPAGTLQWSCWTTAGHIAHDLFAYAGQLTARPDDAYLPMDLEVRAGTANAKVLDIVRAAATTVGLALDAFGPEGRAWHWGPADATAFAAMAVNEMLVHTYDIASGLGLDWQPPQEPCAKVLRRLFREYPPGDPALALLWSTGRIALPGRPRKQEWTVRAAVE